MRALAAAALVALLSSCAPAVVEDLELARHTARELILEYCLAAGGVFRPFIRAGIVIAVPAAALPVEFARVGIDKICADPDGHATTDNVKLLERTMRSRVCQDSVWFPRCQPPDARR